MDPKVTLTSQIKKHLEDKGTISEIDLQQMAGAPAAPPENAAEASPAEDLESKVKAGSESLDKLALDGSKSAVDLAIEEDLIPDSQNPDDPFGLADEEAEVLTITAADKRRFQDCFVDGTRFTREFSICGGRIKGVLRSRKVGESRAILAELTRMAIAGNHSAADYAANCRHALLHCQLESLNGVVRPEFAVPYRALEKVNLESGKVETVPPRWELEMEVVFNGMGDGLENLLYKELKTFEKAYWTMVRSARDQNFWNPEDSTIE